MYDDPWRWWRAHRVAAARRMFVERYAPSSPDWTRAWISALAETMTA